MATGDLELPDVAGNAGGIAPWAQPRALDLTQFLDGETLRSDFGDYLLSFGTVSEEGASPSLTGTVRAIPFDINLKGLVYYPKAAFQAAGYEVPATWDQLMALSSQMVADGRTPWCFGFSSGFASGWPGTDFIEGLVLRVGGLEAYDAWTFGQAGFTSPAVVEASRLADTLIFEPGFIRGGPEAISNEDFAGQLFYMLERDRVTGEAKPDCWLHLQSDFIVGQVPAGTVIGEDLDFFLLPPVDPNQPTPSTGGAPIAVALVDRPEIRAFLEFLASPEWGEIWAPSFASSNVGAGAGLLPANRRFDMSTYGASDDPVVAVLVAMASELRTALDAGIWRFDASDKMPVRIGGWNEDFSPGPFW